MTTAGWLSIVFGILLAVYSAFRKVENGVLYATALMVFVGLLLIFGDGVTEVNLPLGFGFKKVTSQAIADAAAIATLRNRVENQSATVDLVAKRASDAEVIAHSAQSELLKAQQRVNELRQIIAGAEVSLQRLQRSMDTTMIIADAENDDRPALDSLKKLAEDTRNPDSPKAAAAWKNITTAVYTALQLQYKMPWSNSVDVSQFTLSQLSDLYYSLNNQYIKIAMLQYVFSRKDFDLADKLDFFVRVSEDDDSIKAWAVAQHQFFDITKADLPIFDISKEQNWWVQHKGEYIGKH